MPITSGNDLNILQANDPLNFGAGLGNDIYLITPSSLNSSQTINITDTSGVNKIWLIGTTTIASSIFSAESAQLILSSGATINIFGANTFTYTLGENPLINLTSGISYDFQDFITQNMGINEVPIGTNIAAGSSNITINDDGSSSSSSSSSSSGSGTSNFDIVINYTGNNIYEAAFDKAANRWEEIITGDLPDIGNIDDIVIDATILLIDGPGEVLGQAGPDSLRSDGLPFTGTMEFDSADIDLMIEEGIFESVILHEMGHVLGIGTLWDDFFPNSNSLTGQYSGANALREYQILSGNNAANFVSVDTDGGEGTAGGHWDEAIFRTELMTGFAESGGIPTPISRMTIGVLDDLGYTVNYNAADAYSLPTNLASASIIDPSDNGNDLWII